MLVNISIFFNTWLGVSHAFNINLFGHRILELWKLVVKGGKQEKLSWVAADHSFLVLPLMLLNFTPAFEHDQTEKAEAKYSPRWKEKIERETTRISNWKREEMLENLYPFYNSSVFKSALVELKDYLSLFLRNKELQLLF